MLPRLRHLVFALALMLPLSASAADSHAKKKPIDDVNQIGSRNVGGGLDWYSQEKEIALGRSLAQEVESQSRLITDPAITEYVNRVGQNLVRNSDAKVPFTIKVIDSKEVNAFSLPGGFLFINTGLILAADDEAQLAGVMAHEIAHVAARHVTRQETRGDLINFATIPLIFVSGPIGMGAQVAASFLVPIGYMKFSRGFEREADYLGIQYMYKTGYDPRELLAFFEKLQMQEKKQPGTLAKAFATHPQTRDRAHASEKEIASILPPLPEYVIDTSEFERVKAHLENIEGHLNGLKVRDVPVLIRRTSTNTQPVDGTQQAGSTTSPASDTPDPGRPTLRRQPSTGDSNP